MFFNSVQLSNYRNFSQLKLDFDPMGALVYGLNGVGKTNLLEALCFLAYGKSFRTANDTDQIKNGSSFFKIGAQVFCYSTKYDYHAILDSKGCKYIKLNGVRIDRLSELYRYLKIVYFSQNDINLIDGSPKYRRQFFDLAISQNNYRYLSLLRHYLQVVKQRNTLLKNVYSEKEKQIWDDQFAQVTRDIMDYRLSFLKIINIELSKYYQQIGYSSEKVMVSYRHSFKNNHRLGVFDSFLKELHRLADEEKRQQRSLIGPHLDDYIFLLNDKPISRFGSHGQKRSLSIAIQLAQASILTQADNDAAILIFDDVLSDLDTGRTKAIIDSLGCKNQTFIATPQPQPYSNLRLPFLDLGKLL